MKYEQHIKDIENRIKWSDKDNPVTKEEIQSFFSKVANDKRLTNNNKSHLLFQIKKLYKSIA